MSNDKEKDPKDPNEQKPSDVPPERVDTLDEEIDPGETPGPPGTPPPPPEDPGGN